MLIEFYGLKEEPFGMTPNPRFLYLSSMHREAAASLAYGIEAERGFLALIAEPGMGKTTLLYQLLERLRPAARTAFVFQTQCDSGALLRQLVHEFGFGVRTSDPVEITEALKDLLLSEAESNRRVVLMVDEAQNLEVPVLETLRLLSNFETAGRKLLQIILAGQPSLGQKLAAPELLQLRQRVSIVMQLLPFSLREVEAYIEHRLKVAGLKGKSFFTHDACARIAAMSQGIPRNINNICFNALSLAYATSKPLVTGDIVAQVGRDLDSLDPHKTLSLFRARAGTSSATTIPPRKEVADHAKDEMEISLTTAKDRRFAEGSPLLTNVGQSSKQNRWGGNRVARFGVLAVIVASIVGMLASRLDRDVTRSSLHHPPVVTTPVDVTANSLRSPKESNAQMETPAQAPDQTKTLLGQTALPASSSVTSKASYSSVKAGNSKARQPSDTVTNTIAIPPAIDTSNSPEARGQLTGDLAVPGNTDNQSLWPAARDETDRNRLSAEQ